MAAEALDSLGYAEEKSWGFVLHKTPVEPVVLPRWDDVSVVVLLAAEQSGRIRLAGSQEPDVRTGPGTADPLTMAALEELGLVADGRWTDAAIEVLWRVAPDETGLDFRSDDRLARVQQDKVPEGVQPDLDRVSKIQSPFMRKHELEYLFFERWRLGDGWLTDEAGGRALAVFHDPLAAEAASRFTLGKP